MQAFATGRHPQAHSGEYVSRPSALQRFRAALRDESGQTLLMAALWVSVLAGFMGLAIDVGQVVYAKRQLQMGADAAALAGALELSYCNGTANCGALKTAAQGALIENGLTGSTVLTNCGAGTGTRLEIKIDNPPCALGGDPHTGNGSYVEVVVSQPQTLMFARVLGIGSVLLNARSEAGRTGGTNCVYALDPGGLNSIVVDVLANVSANCGIVDESNNGLGAFACFASATVQATQINVLGAFFNSFCNASPTPVTGVAVPSPADPFATLPKPAVPACGSSVASPYHGSPVVVNVVGTVTLYPDAAYCGGIVIFPTANVTFSPGVYVLKTTNNLGFPSLPGGLYIDLGATVNGSGVTFYNFGPLGPVTFNYSFNNGAVHLTAPLSGTYSGVLLMQDPQDILQATIYGNQTSNTVLEGAYYFPRARVFYAYSGLVNYNILVAYQIEFAYLNFAGNIMNSKFTNNYSQLANGSPMSSTGAALMQ